MAIIWEKRLDILVIVFLYYKFRLNKCQMLVRAGSARGYSGLGARNSRLCSFFYHQDVLKGEAKELVGLTKGSSSGYFFPPCRQYILIDCRHLKPNQLCLVFHLM